MGMQKTLILLGASVLALGAMASGVEAKKVYYEINGKRYWYSTNNRAQTAAARKRIAAAKAAEAAKAKAAAERAKNPLVALFGSQAQQEAAKAQADIEAATAGQEPFLAVSRGTRTGQPARDERPVKDVAPKAPPAPRVQTAALAHEGVQLASALAEPAAALALQTRQASTPAVKSVSFDIESGIKTTIMTDGSIQEELFDSSMMTKLASEHAGPGSLTAFVNQLRKALPVETTGSTTPSAMKP